MFSYIANAICMAGMTMPAGAGVAASHCWNRVRKPGQLIYYARFLPQQWIFAKNRTAHAQTHYRKSTQWQWASFVSVSYCTLPLLQNNYAMLRAECVNQMFLFWITCCQGILLKFVVMLPDVCTSLLKEKSLVYSCLNLMIEHVCI